MLFNHIVNKIMSKNTKVVTIHPSPFKTVQSFRVSLNVL